MVALTLARDVQAQSASQQCTTRANCPHPTRDQLNTICYDVSDHIEDHDDASPFAYAFERDLWQMAGARVGKDSDSLAKARIQLLWTMYANDFICSTSNHPNAHILPFAISRNFYTFVEELATTYKLSINVANPVDGGRTMLDWVRDEIVRVGKRSGTDSPVAKELKGIYSSARKLNALYASEM